MGILSRGAAVPDLVVVQMKTLEACSGAWPSYRVHRKRLVKVQDMRYSAELVLATLLESQAAGMDTAGRAVGRYCGSGTCAHLGAHAQCGCCAVS